MSQLEAPVSPANLPEKSSPDVRSDAHIDELISDAMTEVNRKIHVALQSDVVLISQMGQYIICLLYTSPSPRDKRQSRMPSSA